MDITNRLDKFLDEQDIELVDKQHLTNEAMTELMMIQASIDKAKRELKKKKMKSADIYMELQNLSKSVEKIIKKPIGYTQLQEKFYGFGTNGTAEVYGDTVIISKGGKSIEMTKRELADILIKIGVAKKRQK